MRLLLQMDHNYLLFDKAADISAVVRTFEEARVVTETGYGTGKRFKSTDDLGINFKLVDDAKIEIEENKPPAAPEPPSEESDLPPSAESQ